MLMYCDFWTKWSKIIPWIASSKSIDQKHHGTIWKQIRAHNVHPAGVLLRKKLLSPALDPNIGSDAPLQRAHSRVLLLSQRHLHCKSFFRLNKSSLQDVQNMQQFSIARFFQYLNFLVYFSILAKVIDELLPFVTSKRIKNTNLNGFKTQPCLFRSRCKWNEN